MKVRALSQIDFYKAGHRPQYPEGTEVVYSNLTARSGRLAPVLQGRWDQKVVFFGLQFFVIEVLINLFNETFFKKEKEKVVAAYKRRMDRALGEGVVSVDHIEALHDLGYLPIEIRALPEGAVVPIKVPMMTIRNTLPEFFWLTNYLETVWSNTIWKMCTTATISREYKRLLTEFAIKTGADLDFIQFQGHDFSARGMSLFYDAASASAGHMLSFAGTDTVAAIDFLEDYYFADVDKELVGCSVPATEHSVMCMGTKSDEIGTFKRLITELYPTGIVSIVSDTWDWWKVITEYTVELKDIILARNGKVVFRPDSGDPVRIIAGYKVFEHNGPAKGFSFNKAPSHIGDLDIEKLIDDGYELVKWNGKYFSINVAHGSFDETNITDSEAKGAVQCLWDVFGGTETVNGYKVLDSHVGLIYGDSITLERALAILTKLKEKGFASTNVVFGIGSFTYQYLTRDSFGFAVKATYGVVNGEGREIFKDPITDSGTKKSAKGLLRVDLVDGEYVLKDQCTEEEAAGGELRVVFRDGTLFIEHTFAEIKERLAQAA